MLYYALKHFLDHKRNRVPYGIAKRSPNIELFAGDSDEVNKFGAVACKFCDEDGFGNAG